MPLRLLSTTGIPNMPIRIYNRPRPPLGMRMWRMALPLLAVIVGLLAWWFLGKGLLTT